MTSKCVRTAPIIVQANNTAATTDVLGNNRRIAQMTSRPPVKYRNHWPDPDFCKQFNPENFTGVKFDCPEIQKHQSRETLQNPNFEVQNVTQ
jgi:hypothetical protein